MAKRSSTASAAAKRSAANRSKKRVKVEEVNTEPLPSASENVKENDTGNNPSVDLIRDPEYYFEDGSVTFRVRRVLFKLHVSVFKAHSQDFFEQLDLPPSDSDSKTPRGTSDEDAIILSDIQPSQFRNLIKIVYCLPSNDIVFGQLAPSDNKLAGEFECYLDVAILSRKFGMKATQQWAKTKLKLLVQKSGKDLVGKIDEFYNNVTTGNSGDTHLGDNISRSEGEADDEGAETSWEAFRLFEAIQHSKAVSDNTLLHDTTSILEYYFTRPDFDVEFLVSFFRITDLRETAPSLFGFLFLMLLSHGNQAWVEKVFTREDRMALFSAQSFLTPLPEALKESLLSPLFKKPTTADIFIPILSDDDDDGDNGGCESGCHKKIFAQWKKTFPNSYYEAVNDKEFSVSMKALCTLPSHRLDFAAELREAKCQRCRWQILYQLDEDIQELFSQVAKYYKEYD